MLKNLLFDFDGTLVNTLPGIINCMHYAFDKIGCERVADQHIQTVIGKPLSDMLEILLKTEDRDLICRGVEYFRQRYSKDGLQELSLYDGVEETLDYLFTMRVSLFVVTSKPYIFTQIISENLNIARYFKSISGVELTGATTNKAERTAILLNQFYLNPQETAMIGDRAEDIIAAKENHLLSVGVLHGFGCKKELTEAGCDILIENFRDIKMILNP